MNLRNINSQTIENILSKVRHMKINNRFKVAMDIFHQARR
jgi:hypothetical protein